MSRYGYSQDHGKMKNDQALFGWSGRFCINKVCEIAVKLPRSHPNDPLNNMESFVFQKIDISVQNNVVFVRILPEDIENPPYYIENKTKHEILFNQKYINPSTEKSQKCCNFLGTKKGEIETTQQDILYPKDRKPFTWDHWATDEDHILEVEIDKKKKQYDIEKIKEFDPIILSSNKLKKKLDKD